MSYTYERHMEPANAAEGDSHLRRAQLMPWLLENLLGAELWM